MRTPLSNLNMGLRLIDEKITEQSAREKLKIMKISINKLSYKINNVMDFVRVRKSTFRECKLNSILQDCQNRVEIPETEKVTLPEKDLSITCDKEQFEILFLNLIKNSLEILNGKGFIKFYAKETPIEYIIKIEDSELGIPEEYLTQIFDPLVSLKERGTGLGLASCKNIVTSHGGILNVNNPTTFTITIPRSKLKK